MKKPFALVLVLALCLCLLTVGAFASDGTCVTVSISTEGQLSAVNQMVYVIDADTDGVLSIADALACAHDLLYNGGAQAGFAAESTQYGLSLTKLWGVENGGSYGYYVNNIPATSLADPISDGDSIYAFSYEDLTGWSDAYAYFDVSFAETGVEGLVDLCLTVTGYDADWNLTAEPCANAQIYVCAADVSSEYFYAEGATDENGQVCLTFLKPGTYYVTARSEAQIITPPVCTVYVAQEEMNISSMFDEAVDQIHAAGITDDMVIPRQILVEAIYELAGSPDVEGASTFEDVDINNSAIIWASQNGIIQGYGNGCFGGEDDLTHQQLAVVLYRLIKAETPDMSDIPTGDLSACSDANEVADWAVDAVSMMQGFGLYPEGIIRPNDPFTVGDGIALVTAALALIG